MTTSARPRPPLFQALACFAGTLLAAPALAQVHESRGDARPAPARAVDRSLTPVEARSAVVRGPWVSLQANIDAQGNNIPGDAANEPSIGVDPTDPRRMVVGWRQFDSIASNFRENGYAFTTDGGASWAFPGPIQNGTFYSDPVVAVDPQGTFFYASYPGGTTMRTYRSANGGQSWTSLGNTRGGDKAWFSADPSGSGHLYLVWQILHGPNTFSRSTNGGLGFQPAVNVPLTPTFGAMTVAPDGVVYCAGKAGSSYSTFALAVSDNARNPAVTPSFRATQVNMGGSMRLSAGPNPGGLLGQAEVGVDPTRADTVYMLCSVNPSGTDPMDLHFVRSSDGGRSFSTPRRLNTDPANRNSWQWMGTLGVAPTGRIDVAWNDTRKSRTANLCETYYAYSLDGGTTWSANIPVSPAWNSLLGHPSQNKIGDYYDIESTADAAHLAYAATHNGEQDVFYLRLGDCNGNQVHDGVDIQNGTSADSNQNGVPDRCELCQPDLGNGSGLALSLCGDPLDEAESQATLEVSGGPPSSAVAVALSTGRSVPPVALPGGGGLVPDLGAAIATVYVPGNTDPSGRLRTTWSGGTHNATTLYVQAAMLSAGGGTLLLSNALQATVGTR